MLLALSFFAGCATPAQKNHVNQQEILAHIENLKDKHKRRKAAIALVRIGEPAVEPLIRVLRDRNLVQGGAPPIDPLVQYRNNKLCCIVAEVLGQTGDPRAIEPLMKLFEGKWAELHWCAATALAKIGEPAFERVLELLKEEDGVLRSCAAQTLRWMGNKRAVGPLIEALKDKEGYVRSDAALALGEIGDKRAIEPLIENLKDENWNVRESAAVALGDIRDKRAIMPLISILTDEDVEVREAAVLALGDIGGGDAVEAIIGKLKDDDHCVRSSAARALGNIGNQKALEPLIDILKNDQHWSPRYNAAEALGKIGDKKAVAPLIEALKDKGVSVSRHAAIALGEIGDKRALKPLVEALKDGNAFAAEALGDIGDKSVVQALGNLMKEDKQEIVRLGVAAGLAKLVGDQYAFNMLLEGLNSEWWISRQYSAQALGRLRDSRATQYLINALQDEDCRVYEHVADALEKITGQNFGEDYLKWREWYEKSKDK
jgi:HEAT repeat protein